jgi:hypothetical protein
MLRRKRGDSEIAQDDDSLEDDEPEDEPEDEYEASSTETSENEEADEDDGTYDEQDEYNEYDEQGEYEDDDSGESDDLPEGSSEPAEEFKPPGFTQALKQVFSPSGGSRAGGRPKAQPASGTEEDRKAVTYIDKRERMIGFFFGGIQIALGIVGYFADRAYQDKTGKTKAIDLKNTLNIHHAAPLLLGIGVVFGLFTLAATLSKRRAALGFVILLGGLELLQSGGGVFGLVYFGVGIWMIFRALKRNPRNVAAQEARAARANARSGTRAGTSTRSSSSSSSSRSTSTRPASDRTTRPGPGKRTTPVPQTKRYTPPKPRRPIPPKEQPEPEPTNRVMSWLKR